MILQNQPTITHCNESDHKGLGKGGGTAYIVVTEGWGSCGPEYIVANHGEVEEGYIAIRHTH